MSSASTGRLAGAAAGLLIDAIFGEPPDTIHPIVALGRSLQWLETHTYADSRSAGVVHLTVAGSGAVLVGIGAQRAVGRTAATAIAVSVAVAGTMLGDVANGVGRHLETADRERADLEQGDLASAREALRSLVGRDPTNLSEPEIVRAVVESVAENTVDAVTASLFWAAVAGPAGVALHRTVNTLDAMVGHRTARYQRFGWASAKLDDLLNFAPARLTALAVAIVGPAKTGDVLRVVWRDGGNHPSPNGGVVEAGFAGALGITLGGINDYGDVIEQRGPLGDGPEPDGSHIEAAVSLSKRSAVLSLALLAAARWLVRSACRSSGRG